MLSGAGAIFLAATEDSGPTDDLIVAPGVVVSTTKGDISLWAGNHLDLEAGSVVAAGVTGTVTLVFGLEDRSGIEGATLAGTVSGHNPMIFGSGADSFNVIANAGAVIHVNGGLPNSPPGDSLLLDLLGAINPTLAITSFDATGAAGQWTIDNREPVYFTGVDSFANLDHQLNLPLVRG